MHGVPAPAPRRSARIGVHVNRRDALKKLAAGGAIAAGGSLVLSSNAVAETASGPPITGIPGPGEDLTNFVTFSNQGDVTFTHNDTAVCPGGGGVTTTYRWRTVGFTLSPPRNKRLQLLDATSLALLNGNDISATGTCISCTDNQLTSGSNSALLQREISNIKTGDQYTLELEITWECSGSPTVVATYDVAGTYPDPATAVNTYDSRL